MTHTGAPPQLSLAAHDNTDIWPSAKTTPDDTPHTWAQVAYKHEASRSHAVSWPLTLHHIGY